MTAIQIPFDEYLLLEGVNSSALKSMADSPLAYRWTRDNPSPDSASKRLGRVGHVAILEPERYDSAVTVLDGPKPSKASGPEWDAFQAGKAMLKPGRFKARAGTPYKEWAQPFIDDGYAILLEKDWEKCLEWQKYLHHVGRREVIPKSAGELCMQMRDAVRASPEAMRYLSVGMAEITLQFIDPETGILMKVRIDWLACVNGAWVLVDLKTARSINEREFFRQMSDFSTHQQLAIYRDALRANGINVERVVIIAVRNSEPVDAGVFPVCPFSLEAGQQHYREMLRKVKKCRESGEWPGRYAGKETLFEARNWAVGMDNEDDDISFTDED